MSTKTYEIAKGDDFYFEVRFLAETVPIQGKPEMKIFALRCKDTKEAIALAKKIKGFARQRHKRRVTKASAGKGAIGWKNAPGRRFLFTNYKLYVVPFDLDGVYRVFRQTTRTCNELSGLDPIVPRTMAKYREKLNALPRG